MTGRAKTWKGCYCVQMSGSGDDPGSLAQGWGTARDQRGVNSGDKPGRVAGTDQGQVSRKAGCQQASAATICMNFT